MQLARRPPVAHGGRSDLGDLSRLLTRRGATVSRDTGGAAFPGEYYSPDAFVALRPTEGVIEARRQATGTSQGMTLRDWFAGNTLASLLCVVGVPEDGPDTLWDASIAERAYALADAMLAERAKP